MKLFDTCRCKKFWQNIKNKVCQKRKKKRNKICDLLYRHRVALPMNVAWVTQQLRLSCINSCFYFLHTRLSHAPLHYPNYQLQFPVSRLSCTLRFSLSKPSASLNSHTRVSHTRQTHMLPIPSFIPKPWCLSYQTLHASISLRNLTMHHLLFHDLFGVTMNYKVISSLKKRALLFILLNPTF